MVESADRHHSGLLVSLILIGLGLSGTIRMLFLINWVTVLIVVGLLVYFIIEKRNQKESTVEPTPPKAEPLSLQQLCTPSATISRKQYLLWGIILFAIKYNLDRAIAAFTFHKSWTALNYFNPMQTLNALAGVEQWNILQHWETIPDREFYGVIATLALPFIWAGVVLTIQRLRDLKLSPGWAVLFFVPFINLLMFLILSILPGTQDGEHPKAGTLFYRFLDRLIPDNEWGSAALGVFLTLLLGILGLQGAAHLGQYGWGLFLGLPFCLGLISVLVYGYHRPRKLSHCLAVSALAIGFCGLLILILAFEGIICLLMAAPIGLTLGLMGGAVGYAIQIRQNRPKNDTFLMLLTLILGWPLLIGAEAKLSGTPPVYAVESIMEINAPPETVWNNVVTFSQLPEPTEWLFHTGIAYPIRAEIQGRGVGAIRHCIFSTGEFVEPIEVWDKPHRLGFGVQTMPLPMHEWSYKEIHPPHLDEYLQVTHGEFRLEALPGNKTRLLGTTWYSNKVWPSLYWKTWSDGIIHAIHLRVLRHIKHLSEEV